MGSQKTGTMKELKKTNKMKVLKYTLLLCCAAVIHLSSNHDDFLSTPYIIKSIAILLLVLTGIVMVVRDIKKGK